MIRLIGKGGGLTPSLIAIWSGLLLMSIACGSPSATGASRPTPDVEGTVEARVEATLAAIPTSTPDLALGRMKRAAMAEVLLKEKVVIVNLLLAVRPMIVEFRGGYYRNAELYVPIYMASACLEGREPSAQGFKDFTVTWFAQDVSPEPKALTTIQEIREQISPGVPPEKLCLQPYHDPVSVADGGLAVDLYLAAVLRSIPIDFRTGLNGAIQRHARKWFETDRQQPFIIFLCEESPVALRQEC